MYCIANKIIMREGKEYDERQRVIENKHVENTDNDGEDVRITQISTTKGIMDFGYRDIHVVLVKFGHLDEKKVEEPLNPEKITPYH